VDQEVGGSSPPSCTSDKIGTSPKKHPTNSNDDPGYSGVPSYTCHLALIWRVAPVAWGLIAAILCTIAALITTVAAIILCNRDLGLLNGLGLAAGTVGTAGGAAWVMAEL
jgi:hypothetical protein